MDSLISNNKLKITEVSVYRRLFVSVLLCDVLSDCLVFFLWIMLLQLLHSCA